MSVFKTNFYPDSWGVREGLTVNTSALHYNKKLQTAEAYFKGRDAQFTPLRRKVLAILLKNNMRAVGAYELLEDLREAGFRSQPPVAYRALEFLMKHGFVHKIERLNAFVACSLPGSLFLACPPSLTCLFLSCHHNISRIRTLLLSLSLHVLSFIWSSSVTHSLSLLHSVSISPYLTHSL